MVRAPEIRYFSVFMAICEEGGFHRAADELGLSQSAVSYQVRRLEDILGVALFERTGRSTVLTNRGRLLRDHCRKLFGDLEALRRALREGSETAAGTLEIASVSGFGRYVLFPVLKEEFADVRVHLRFPPQKEVVRLVSGGVCELGFLYEQRVSSHLVSMRLGREELVLVHAPKMRVRAGSFDLVVSLPFVTWDEHEYVFGQWFERVFERQPGPLSSVSEFEELEEVVDYVSLGFGVSILPDHCVRRDVEAGRLAIARPARRKRCWNDLFLIRRADAWLSAPAERLIGRLTSG